MAKANSVLFHFQHWTYWTAGGRSHCLLFSHTQCVISIAQQMQWAPKQILLDTDHTYTHTMSQAHVHTHTHTHKHTQHTHRIVYWWHGKKCHTWKNATIWVKEWNSFLANCSVIYKFVWDITRFFFFFWHLCKRQGECIHNKMFTFNGKTTHNGSLKSNPFSSICFQILLSTMSAFYTGKVDSPELHISLGSNKRNGMTSTFLCFQTSTQKPCCGSYMWQVLMLPKWRVSLATWFWNTSESLVLRYPYNTLSQHRQKKAT